MAFLLVVFWAGFCFACYKTHDRYPIPQPLQTLRRKANAVYAILSLVPPEGPSALACSALPGSMLALRLVGGFDVLELLSLV